MCSVKANKSLKKLKNNKVFLVNQQSQFKENYECIYDLMKLYVLHNCF